MKTFAIFVFTFAAILTAIVLLPFWMLFGFPEPWHN